MSSRKNKFSSALRHLNSNQIDEKIKKLEEQPTNNTSGIYTLSPPDPAADPTVYTPSFSDITILTPDFAIGEDPDNATEAADTSGLFNAEGVSLTAAPPGDNSYILGPMATMYYAWASRTQIGYIRQSDRRMVNLGYISGNFGDWDGSEAAFNSYGQLTLEQAQWYRTIGKKDGADNSTENYRAFYPGPPSSVADAYGRYLCTITGDPKDVDNSYASSTTGPKNGPMNANDNFAAQKKKEEDEEDDKPDRDDYPPGRAGAKKYQDDLKKWKDDQKDKGEEGEEETPDDGKGYRSPKDRGGQGGNDQEWRDKGDKTGDPASDSASDPASDYTAPKDRGGQGDTDGVDPNEPGLVDKAKEAWDWYVDNKEAVDAAAGEVMNAVDAAMAIASVVGVLFPEAGTSIAGAAGIASLANKFKKAYNAVKAGKSAADVIGGKNKGLSGAGSFDVGATGVKKGGFDALNPNQIGPTAQHTGSGGILSPGGGMVYSAPKVGQTGPSAVNPGSGASKYSQYGSNPFSQSSKGGGDPGGVIGSIVNKGNASVGIIEPQSTQTPAQFNKSSKIFNDIMNGKYQNSPTAQKIYQKGIDAGFTGGSGSIGHSNLPKQTSVPNVGKTLGGFSKFASKYTPTHGHLGTFGGVNYESYLIENTSKSKKELRMQGDKEDIMIMHMLKKPEILKKLPLIIKGLEQEKELSAVYGAIFGFEGRNIKESLFESKKIRIMKTLKEPVVLPEGKKKSYKVRPGRRGKTKTDFRGMDKLIGDIKIEKTFKEPQDVWNKDWHGHNQRVSQGKKNIVLELIGQSTDAFNYMLNDSKKMNAKQMEEFWGLHPEMHSHFYNGKKYKTVRKEQLKGDRLVFLVDEKGVKTSILQSKLNDQLAQKHDQELLDEYNKLNPKKEPIEYKKDPLIKKVMGRLKNEIDYPDKPARKGYPNKPPPKMVNGMHPKFGKNYKYDKLDSVSAVMMSRAPTGDPEIDANVRKAARKPK